jgi:hypothetical protein
LKNILQTVYQNVEKVMADFKRRPKQIKTTQMLLAGGEMVESGPSSDILCMDTEHCSWLTLKFTWVFGVRL